MLGRGGAIVALLLVVSAMCLFLAAMVGAARQNLANQEDRLAGKVHTPEERDAYKAGRRHRRRLLLLAIALVLAAGPLLPPIS